MRSYLEKFFFKRGRIGKVYIDTGCQVATDHDTVDGFWRIGGRDVDDQYLFAVFTQDVPDGLFRSPLCLYMDTTGHCLFGFVCINPVIIDTMTSRFQACREGCPGWGREWWVLRFKD